eukprot:g12240.t1
MSESCTVDPDFKYLSIYGRGANNLTVLTAAEGQRHFIVNADAILKLTYVKLQGGRSLGAYLSLGGSIYVLGSLYVSNCYFYDNQAKVGGGAIAFFLNSKTSKIENTIFENNKVENVGGAIYIVSAILELIIENCDFNNNQQTAEVANGGGGAISIPLAASNFVIKFTRFSQNSANSNYGHTFFIIATGTIQLIDITVTTCNTNANNKECDANDDIYNVLPPLCNTINPNPCSTTCINHSRPEFGIRCPCAAGTFGVTTYMGCQQCTAGRYANVNGMTSCDVCPSNSYTANSLGTITCTPCPSGKFTLNTRNDTNGHDAVNDCYSSPILTNINPNNHTTSGNVLTTFNFDMEFEIDFNATISVQMPNGNLWTNCTRVDHNTFTAISPSGVGANLALIITIDGVAASSTEILFSYKAANITSVISPPFNGGVITLMGTDFGSTINDVDIINVYNTNGCSFECVVLELFLAPSKIYCQYNQAGSFGVTREIDIVVGDQRSVARGSFTYEFNKGELNGVPLDVQIVSEMEELTYVISLSDGIPPSKNVIITLEATSTKGGALNCTVNPASVTILANDNGTEIPVTIKTDGNLIDEGTDAVSYSCIIKHTIATTDPQYATSPQRTVMLNIINDDEADVKLWTIDANDQYTYAVKFLSFFNLEGSTFQYGVQLDTQPTHNVHIVPNITLSDHVNMLSPPQLVGHPKFLTFTPSNWSQYQRFTYASIPDNVDNDLLDFNIFHNIVTSDVVFYEKVTRRDLLATVNAADDDTAKIILMENKVLTLQPEEEAKSITITHFASKPAHDVIIQVKVPSNKIEIIYDENVNNDNTVLIPKNRWNNINYELKFRAKSGAPSGEMTIGLIPQSLDPKYNASNDGIASANLVGEFVNIIVPEIGSEPLTNITVFPPTRSAWQQATFQFYSPNPEVVKFEWKLDGGPYKELLCPGTSISSLCMLNTSLLVFGRHRLEARAVSNIGQRDGSPAFIEWTVDHCNDPNGNLLQYAKIEDNGAIQCFDCPQPLGVECGYPDDEWGHIYALPNWWTAGTRTDTYYKCPFPDSCLGGLREKKGPNGTFTVQKSRCAVGYDHSAPVCAVCADEYVFQQNRCVSCPGYLPGKSTSPTRSMMVAGFLCMSSSIVFMYLFFTIPTLSRSEEEDLRVKLSKLDLDLIYKDNRELTHAIFSEFLDGEKMTETEILYIFHVVDEDESGFLSRAELEAYITNDGKIDIEELQAKQDEYQNRYWSKRPSFTAESVKTRLYTFATLTCFGLYTGISTRIFRLFKCRKIDNDYYLTSDYSMKCYTEDWWSYAGVAIFCMIIYVVGIPLVQFIILLRNRHHLHEESALDHESHRLTKKKFGSIYENYIEECYYYDLLDLLRRLILTGGLILVGEHSVIQILLGILTSMFWLLIVAIKFPYKAYWDNILSIALSLALVLSLICGFTLQLFHATRPDTNESIDGTRYEDVIFDWILTSMSVVCVFLGIIACVLTVPVFQNYLGKYLLKENNNLTEMKQWMEKQKVLVKWLHIDDLKTALKVTTATLEKKAEISRKQHVKNITKVRQRNSRSAINNVSILPIVDTNSDSGNRILSSGSLIHVKKMKTIASHHAEVGNIKRKREEGTQHLRRKHEEVRQRSEAQRKNLERRLQQRKSLNKKNLNKSVVVQALEQITKKKETEEEVENH